MLTLIAWRLAAILLMVAGSLAFLPADTYPLSVAAQGEGEKKKNGEDKKNNQGDNKSKDKNKKEDKDKDKGPKNDNDGEVVAAVAYAVDVQCEYDEDAVSTTCSFTGVAPPDAKDVSHVDLPQEEVCAEVTDGTFEYVDPDPNTGVTGYKSRGSEGSFTLVLDGEVTAAGTATYWFKTGDGVFPATGPGLSCEQASAEFVVQTPEETAEETAVVTDGTGALLVDIYSCTAVPEDTTSFDWFGECDPEGGVHDFTLAPAGAGAVEPLSQASDGSGNTSFNTLDPGLYSLELVGAKWCHAVSDNVDAKGQVAIEAGERTTVWGFICEDDGVK